MRRSAAHAFFLAVFALFGGECRVRATPSASIQPSPDVCAFEPNAKVSDACASYGDLDTLNNKLHPYVRNLANNTDFFSYYRLNLYNKECPFWSDENGLCGNIACAVTTVENEEDIPEIWRAHELSKLEGPKAQHPGRQQQRELNRPLHGHLGDDVGESCVVEYDDECDDRDYCVPEDESASAKGDYVSLAENPERFTGYAGEGAHQVWEAIYRENCFSRPGGESEESAGSSGMSAPAFGFQAQAALDFKQVVKAHGREQARQMGDSIEETPDFEDECLEKRVFYRVISGMHASISTHLCYDYLNQTTGQWGPNLQCFKDRLQGHPERISNLYFNYAFVLRAVAKLRDYVQDYTFCTGDPIQDQRTKQMIRTLADVIPSGPEIFDESVMFQDRTASGISLKEDFRHRFRNVSRIMDCVGCDKCRLWGKVQTAGLGTALKVLFEFGDADAGEDKPILRRTELVALINTLDKISSALKAVDDFRGMMSAEHEAKHHAEQLQHEVNVAPMHAKQSPLEHFNDLDALDDFDDHEASRETSLNEDFWAELDLVYRAFKYIVYSWIGAPKLTGTIVVVEMGRLWDAWLGRPVRERTWEFSLPTREDLFREEL